MVISRRTAIKTGLALTLLRTSIAAANDSIVLRTEDGRDSTVSIWPAVGRQRGVILFSHGALSAPAKYPKLLEPWSMAGFRILAPLHVDSTDYPDHAKYDMVGSWRARLFDMRALAAFAKAPHYVAAGHSYGALVALTLGGANSVVPPGIEGPLRDKHATSVVAFSPPGPSPGLVTAEGYAGLAVPALIQTGDKDIPVIGPSGDWHDHLVAYDEAPPGNKYALVLAGVDHYFGGIICRPELPGPPQTDAFDHAVELSTDFLGAFGAGDAAARRRLDAALTDTGDVQLRRK